MTEASNKVIDLNLNDRNENMVYVIGGRRELIAIELCPLDKERVRVAIRYSEGYRVRKTKELSNQEINDLENQLR